MKANRLISDVLTPMTFLKGRMAGAWGGGEAFSPPECVMMTAALGFSAGFTV
jgi:hypothetical protein